jgi:hyperosmotically inducible protein
MSSKILATAIALAVAGAAAGCASFSHEKVASNEAPAAHRGPVRTADDAAITAKVKAKLVADATVKARKIDVDTMRGYVTLYGDVHSSREADRAVAIARDTDGVTGVTSHLHVIG